MPSGLSVPGLGDLQAAAVSEIPSVVREELAEFVGNGLLHRDPSAVSQCPSVVRKELAESRQEQAAKQSERGVDPTFFAAVAAGWVFNGILANFVCCRRDAVVRREWQRNLGCGVLD